MTLNTASHSISQVLRTLLILLVAFVSATDGLARTTLSDEEIKQQIIQNSIAKYPGPCPCPYNTMSNGNACGGRSAYSKPGGYSPICYPSDVTQQMIDQFRRQSR